MAFTFDDADAFAVGDALGKRGWYVDQQQPPPSLHCTVNAVHAGVIADFLAALQESIAEVRAAEATATPKAYGSLEEARRHTGSASVARRAMAMPGRGGRQWSRRFWVRSC